MTRDITIHKSHFSLMKKLVMPPNDNRVLEVNSSILDENYNCFIGFLFLFERKSPQKHAWLPRWVPKYPALKIISDMFICC